MTIKRFLRFTWIAWPVLLLLPFSGCSSKELPPPASLPPTPSRVSTEQIKAKLVRTEGKEDNLVFNLYNGSNYVITEVTFDISEYNKVQYEKREGKEETLETLFEKRKVISKENVSKKFRKTGLLVDPLSAQEILITDTGIKGAPGVSDGNFSGVEIVEALGLPEPEKPSPLQNTPEERSR